MRYRSGPDLDQICPDLDSTGNCFFDVEFYAHWPPYVFSNVLVSPFFLDPDLSRSGAVPKLERNWPDLGKNWSLNAGVLSF